jgi:predicted ATPase
VTALRPTFRPGLAPGRTIEIPARGDFVGREAEKRALGRSIDGGARLVTITGAGGMGKTRLAAEWARSAQGDLQHGGTSFFFCDLSESRSIDDVCTALGRALGTPLAAGGTADDAVAQLGCALAEAGACVVLLDNMEQLAALAPRMLTPWLALAPRASFIVTSRERLRLDDEVCLGLEPLGVPPADEQSLQEIAASEAVALFVARTRKVRFDYELTEADARSISAIVRQVDGIPLAIELCAARMGVLAPKQILARLSRRFELLVTNARDAPVQKATLRGVIDASWDLLEPWEKDALAQCSVFRGGFSLEAAEAVLDLGAGRDGSGPPPVLDVLQALHEKSLLRAFDSRPASGERRYGLLESIREYAEEKLDQFGVTAQAVERHTAYFLGLGPAIGAALPQAPNVQRVGPEVDNLIAVCTRALAGSKPLAPKAADAALRGLLLLEPVLLTCAKGRLEPYVEMLDAALEAAPTPVNLGFGAQGAAGGSKPQMCNLVLRARALYTRALADLLRGRIMDCFSGFQRALDAARIAGSRPDECLALTKLGVMLDFGDHPDEARECFDLARAITIDLGEPALQADWMLSYGGALIWRGRAADALGYLEQAVEGFRVAGDPRAESVACTQLALTRLSLARLDEAEVAAARTLELLEVTEDRRTEGYVLAVLGRIAQARGRFDDARAQFSAALSIHRAVRDRWLEGVLRGFLGNVAFEEGHLEAARLAYSEALGLLQGTGERHYSTILRAALGAVEVGLGRLEIATNHFDAAVAKLQEVRTTTARIAVQLHCAHGEIARSREAATAKIALAQAAPDGGLSPALCAEDVRFAIRLLERELRRPVSSAAPREVLAAAVPAPVTFIVGPEARWFRPPDGAPVNMLKARAARLVLWRLVRRRIEAPGRALALEEIFEAGWPGERISRKAAANRVYVTLTKLRQLGLGSHLQSRDDGFLLDPTAIVLEAPGLGE